MHKPTFRVGVGLRRPMAQWTEAFWTKVGVIEVLADNLEDPMYARLVRRVRVERPCVAHFLSTSICSGADLDSTQMTFMVEACAALQPQSCSDHLAFTASRGVRAEHFLAPPLCGELVDRVARKAERISRRIGRPFMLENVAHYFHVPGGAMEEPEFWCRLHERDAGVGMLLDLNNLLVNARNFGFSPEEYLNSLPAALVSGVHIAGHHIEGELWVDGHATPVAESVLSLLELALSRFAPEFVIVERDRNLDEATLLNDVDEANRRVVERATNSGGSTWI